MKTTFEMDSLLTEEDIRNRFQVVLQCQDCKKWTQMKHDDHTHFVPCINCGKINYDSSSIKSLRTYRPDVDNKRKPKVKK